MIILLFSIWLVWGWLIFSMILLLAKLLLKRVTVLPTDLAGLSNNEVQFSNSASWLPSEIAVLGNLKVKNDKRFLQHLKLSESVGSTWKSLFDRLLFDTQLMWGQAFTFVTLVISTHMCERSGHRKAHTCWHSLLLWLIFFITYRLLMFSLPIPSLSLPGGPGDVQIVSD